LGFNINVLLAENHKPGHFSVKNTPDIALVGCKRPLGVIFGPERHLFETDGYLKMPPV